MQPKIFGVFLFINYYLYVYIRKPVLKTNIQSMGVLMPSKIQRNILNTAGNVIAISPSSTGKTFGAVLMVLNNISVENQSLQAAYICLTYDGAIQVRQIFEHISAGMNINIKLVTKEQPAPEHLRNVQICIGTTHDLINKLEMAMAANGDIVNGISLVVFDDADKSMTSEKVDQQLIKKLNRQTKIVALSSHPIKRDLLQKIGNHGQANVCSVQEMSNNIRHYVFCTSYELKLELFKELCKFICESNSNAQAIVFSKVRFHEK